MFRRSFVLLALFSLLYTSVAAQNGALTKSVAAPNGRLSYPKAKKVDQVDDYHGVKVSDPFRWMEDSKSADLQAWIEHQNRLTESYLASIPERDKIKARLTELWNYERYSAPSRVGNYYIYSKNDGLQNQSVLYITDSVDSPGRVLLDPNKLSADGTAALSGSSFTEDGKLWAYGV